MCMENQNCQSFMDESSKICKLFNRSVDPCSGKDTGILFIYTKRGMPTLGQLISLTIDSNKLIC